MGSSMNLGMTCIAGLMAAPAALGGGVVPDDADDIFVGFDGARLTTNRIVEDGAGGFFAEPARVFTGVFGEAGIPGFADDPGYFSTGVLAEGTAIGFNVRDALRRWNGSDFDAIAGETITLARAFGVPGLPEVTTPALAGGFVPGFVFAAADASGTFDEHVDLVLSDPGATGIYLLQLELFIGPGRGAGASLPYWIVMGNEADKADLASAAAHVEAFIVPAPGPAVLMLTGLAAGRRRRS